MSMEQIRHEVNRKAKQLEARGKVDNGTLKVKIEYDRLGFPLPSWGVFLVYIENEEITVISSSHCRYKSALNKFNKLVEKHQLSIITSKRCIE